MFYDGLFIFSKVFRQQIYRLCLLLHCGLYILASPSVYLQFNEIADFILRTFVKQSKSLFGQELLTYNVHSLSHLALECKSQGCLDSFSAFKYENYLYAINGCLQSHYRPLEQLANRYSEAKTHLTKPVKCMKIRLRFLPRGDGVLKDRPVEQYSLLKIGNTTLKIDKLADHCFVTKQGDYVLLTSVAKTKAGGEVMLEGRKFSDINSLYSYPMQSSSLGIVRARKLDLSKNVWCLRDFKQKCVVIADVDTFVIIPLIHELHL